MQATELLIAGFPCIDVSRAGLRRGLDGQVRLALGSLTDNREAVPHPEAIGSQVTCLAPARQAAWHEGARIHLGAAMFVSQLPHVHVILATLRDM